MGISVEKTPDPAYRLPQDERWCTHIGKFPKKNFLFYGIEERYQKSSQDPSVNGQATLPNSKNRQGIIQKACQVSKCNIIEPRTDNCTDYGVKKNILNFFSVNSFSLSFSPGDPNSLIQALIFSIRLWRVGLTKLDTYALSV